MTKISKKIDQILPELPFPKIGKLFTDEELDRHASELDAFKSESSAMYDAIENYDKDPMCVEIDTKFKELEALIHSSSNIAYEIGVSWRNPGKQSLYITESLIKEDDYILRQPQELMKEAQKYNWYIPWWISQKDPKKYLTMTTQDGLPRKSDVGTLIIVKNEEEDTGRNSKHNYRVLYTVVFKPETFGTTLYSRSGSKQNNIHVNEFILTNVPAYVAENNDQLIEYLISQGKIPKLENEYVKSDDVEKIVKEIESLERKLALTRTQSKAYLEARKTEAWSGMSRKNKELQGMVKPGLDVHWKDDVTFYVKYWKYYGLEEFEVKRLHNAISNDTSNWGDSFSQEYMLIGKTLMMGDVYKFPLILNLPQTNKDKFSEHGTLKLNDKQIASLRSGKVPASLLREAETGSYVAIPKDQKIVNLDMSA